MRLRIPLACAAGFVFFQFSSVIATGQLGTPLCHPSVSNPIVVASPQQRYDAGQKAEPPLTDQNNGFAWPDAPIGIIKTENGYEFFASDGGQHSRQTWHGHLVGNNKYGSVVTTLGTLDNPLGSEIPRT